MDLLRPRAIPALIAALAAAMDAGAACEALNGTYRYEASGATKGSLGLFVVGRDREKITRQEGGSKGQGFGSTELRARPKVTVLASTGTLAANDKGATIEYRDAHGKPLAVIGIGDGWICKGNALERDTERTAGLGDNIRTERVHETLSKVGRDLAHVETTTVIDPPGGKPKRSEVRFPPAS